MGKWADGTGTLATDAVREVPLEVAASYRARRRGLLGRDGIAGAMLIVRTNSVHTFGMRFAIDVAYLDRSFTVRSVVTMRPGRLGMIRPRGRHVLEAEAGAMAGWGLRPGVRVRVEVETGSGLGNREGDGNPEGDGKPQRDGNPEGDGAGDAGPDLTAGPSPAR